MMYSFNRQVIFSLLPILLFFQGCILVDNVRRPDKWPPIAKHDNTDHWNEFIPVNSLQQLSEVYKTPDLILYQQKGYRPYLHVQGVWIADLNFINSTLADTIQIWSTLEKGPYRWDNLKKISARVSNDEIKLLIKYPNNSQGGNPFLGWSRSYIKIYKSRENDLLIRNGSKMIGLVFMLFPIYGHFSTWYRYEPDMKQKCSHIF